MSVEDVGLRISDGMRAVQGGLEAIDEGDQARKDLALAYGGLSDVLSAAMGAVTAVQGQHDNVIRNAQVASGRMMSGARIIDSLETEAEPAAEAIRAAVAASGVGAGAPTSIAALQESQKEALDDIRQRLGAILDEVRVMAGLAPAEDHVELMHVYGDRATDRMQAYAQDIGAAAFLQV